MGRFYEIPRHEFAHNFNKEKSECRKLIIDLSHIFKIDYYDDVHSYRICFANGYQEDVSRLEGEKVIAAWKSYHNNQGDEKLKLENETLKQMLRDQINGKLETVKLLKEVLEK